MRAKDLSRRDAEIVFTAAREIAKAVKPERLGRMGPRVENWPQCYAYATGVQAQRVRRQNLPAEIPFVLEAYAEIADRPSALVSVNRTPIAAEVTAVHEKEAAIIIGCGLNHSFPVGRRPMRLCLNIDTPHMPITNDGKAPDLAPFLQEIGTVLNAVFTRAKRRGPGKSAPAKLTEKDVMLGALNEAIGMASGSGIYRFSIRQLFYAIRPYVLAALGKAPEYGYFSQVITDYESAHDDIPGMYRDPRGTVFHPHIGGEIQLGTLQVEDYHRPEFNFNKLLYCEKEGLFSILKPAKWPERHDCAVMSGKGFASRAARDFIDSLGRSGEPLTIFCIHDADASGTMIYQTLQEATTARPGRNVQIINLGLEPDEALDLGLQVEEFKPKSNKAQPVADYVVDPKWRHWLKTHRVELNAMTSPQFLEWLDGKMKRYDKKVVPPQAVLDERLVAEVRAHLEKQITEQVLRDAQIQKRVDEELKLRDATIRQTLPTLAAQINARLISDPTLTWTKPLAHLAQTVAGRISQS